MEKKYLTLSRFIAVFLVTALLCARLFVLIYSGLKPETPLPLTKDEQKTFFSLLDENFPSRKEIISPLPYGTVPADLNVSTHSVILIDTATGSILYEKNADEEIPPASMTKLVEMYVVYEAIAKGEVSLDDVVALPPESWATNLPKDASIMFLAQGQTVTLDELLLGLAIASGNDASIAVAHHVCGTMDAFVERMNEVCRNLGLTHTHFVESSGYSEFNMTTAREFAKFCRVYIQKYPESLEKYHSQKVLNYPQEHNLPSYLRNSTENQTITQYNTNKLLRSLPGCDGLKTGFIYESGYNLSLTAERYGNRFLAVMMKGPGTGSTEGNKYRIEDGTTLMEFAFSSFADYHAPTGEKAHRFTVGVKGTKEESVSLVPAFDETLTVPNITGGSPTGAASSVHVLAEVPDILWGKVESGVQYGTLHYLLGETLLRSVPLVAERNLEKTKLAEPLAFASYKIIQYLLSK